jgi:hypothetical protein
VSFLSCTITGNTAGYGNIRPGQGGGVYVYSGTVTFSLCTITGNIAAYNGVPNVYVNGGTVCSWSTTLTGVYGSVLTCPAPPPQLPPAPPPPNRPGVFVVSPAASLAGALANTALAHIVLAPGTYILSTELSITRSVVLEAAVAGSVVLDAQASSSRQRRVLYINPGSLGVVQLIGLNITGGYRWDVSLRGGGVYISSGTVSFSSCTISGNTANNVCAHAQNFPWPHGKIADLLASTLARTTATDALVNYRLCVPQRP